MSDKIFAGEDMLQEWIPHTYAIYIREGDTKDCNNYRGVLQILLEQYWVQQYKTKYSFTEREIGYQQNLEQLND
jgi:hypothetical protein